MLRRRHKKSRGGCSQCKARHVKCDEHRPICRLCELSDRARECSFAAQLVALESPPVATSPSPSHPNTSLSQVSVANNGVPGTPAAGASSKPSPMGQQVVRSVEVDSVEPKRRDSSHEDVVNLDHMELMAHLALNKDLFNWDGGSRQGLWPSPDTLQTALQHPYLLHQLLAFSACHLAFLHPQKAASYSHQAVSLQTRAISLFNTAYANGTEVDKDNCVAALIFSSILGHHLLAETLAKRDHGSLEAFVSHFVQSLDVQRGVRAIAHKSWPLLMKSELEPVILNRSMFHSQRPRGPHCQRIGDMIEHSQELGDSEKEACRLAVHFLQLGFDAVESDQESSQMIFLWGIMAPPEYSELLKAGRFEARVILVYYAWLLHHGRHKWQVRDAGAYILGMLVRHLGSESRQWIEYPMQMMEKDVPASFPQESQT